MNITSILPFFMLGATGIVVFSKKLSTGLVAMSLFNMVLVVYFTAVHAPDVAITEASLGAGLSSLVFLIAIRKIKERAPMIHLQDYFTRKNVVTISSQKSGEIAKQLITLSLSDCPESLRKKVIRHVVDQRNLQEINLGKGIALTHERIDELDEIRTAVGILEKPVRYFKGPTVSMVVCVFLPNEKSREYLSMMAKFTRFLSRYWPEEIGSPAAEVPSAEEFLKALKDFEEE